MPNEKEVAVANELGIPNPAQILPNFQSFVEQLKANVSFHSLDEASTKQAVILRALAILGWDTFDVGEVCPEFAVGERRVDYALRIDGKNKVFIEVKRPAEHLEDHQRQLLEYSFAEGVPLAVLTNGTAWWFYLPLQEGSWEQRKFYSVDIQEQDSGRIGLVMASVFAREVVRSGDAILNAKALHEIRDLTRRMAEILPKVWNRLLTTESDSLIIFLAERAEKESGLRPESGHVESFLKYHREKWIVAEELKDRASGVAPRERKPMIKGSKVLDFTGKSVRSYTLRGKRHQTKTWKDLLVGVCSRIYWLHSMEFERILGLAGTKRQYFSKDQNELVEPRPIEATGVFVETNLSANKIVRVCHDALRLFGHEPDELTLELG